MLNDMMHKDFSICFSDYDISVIHECLSKRYISIFHKLFKLTFLSYYGDFCLLRDYEIGFTDHGLVRCVGDSDYKSFTAANGYFEQSRTNRRSLCSLIHSINIAACNQFKLNHLSNYLDLDCLSARLTKCLLY